MSFKPFSCLAALAAVAFSLAPLPAEAGASLGARGGSAVYAADATCFSPDGASITNGCSTAKYWHVELLLGDAPSNNGTYQVLTAVVTVRSADSNNNVSCLLTSAYKNGVRYDSSNGGNWAQPPVVGTQSDIGPLSVTVPPFGTAAVDCFLNPQSTVYTVHFY